MAFSHTGIRRRWRRSIYEAFGSDRYSRPALNQLDAKLERYLDYGGGFFIEAGANDGYRSRLSARSNCLMYSMAG